MTDYDPELEEILASIEPVEPEPVEPEPLEPELLNREDFEIQDGLPSAGLLSFYDSLRGRVEGYCERKAGKLGKATIDALLVVPDIFILLVRLTLDREVPKSHRAMMASSLAYFIVPIDLFPEGLLGPIGFMDDMVVAAAVLAQAFGGELEPYASKHWSGSRKLKVVLEDVSKAAHSILGDSLYGRVNSMLARHGVEVPPEAEAGSREGN